MENKLTPKRESEIDRREREIDRQERERECALLLIELCQKKAEEEKRLLKILKNA